MRWELGHQNAHRRERAMDRTVKRSRRGRVAHSCIHFIVSLAFLLFSPAPAPARNKYALGGHQNAHRFERAMDWTLKRNRRRGFIDYYPPFSPFAGFPALAGAGGEGRPTGKNRW
nr:leucine-rich repeat extensin-like protein 1 [Ipomoea batatas]